MIDLIAKLLTIFIPIKNTRRYLRDKIKTLIYGYDVIKRAKYIGKNFRCGGYCTGGKGLVIKDNVRINGINITGDGKIIIGNYCQLGIDILVVAQNHNFTSILFIHQPVQLTIWL